MIIWQNILSGVKLLAMKLLLKIIMILKIHLFVNKAPKCSANEEPLEYTWDTVPSCRFPDPSKVEDLAIMSSGCQCEPGYLQSGDKCVKPEHCGCLRGFYFEVRNLKYLFFE